MPPVNMTDELSPPVPVEGEATVKSVVKKSKKVKSVKKTKKSKKRSRDATSDGTSSNKKRAVAVVDEANEEVVVAQVVVPVLSGKEFRAKHTMIIQGKDSARSGAYIVPEPILSFDDSPFSKTVLGAIAQAGFTAPSPIQAQAWPIVLQGRDIISVARTGSGKTCGFLLPSFETIHALEKLGKGAPPMNNAPQGPRVFGRGGQQQKRPAASPLAVVLAPTRELAIQIEEEAQRFGAVQGIRTVAIYGGDSKYKQIHQLQTKQPQMVVATPGRLTDLAHMGVLSLQLVSILILDEADRMLDMGFEPQLDEILTKMTKQTARKAQLVEDTHSLPTPTQRQTLFFTATWPKAVQRVADKFLHNPVQLNVGLNDRLVANEDIQQIIKVMDEKDKHETLTKTLMALPPKSKTLIFFMKKTTVNRTTDALWNEGYHVDSLHGDKEQWKRTRIMADFKDSKIMTLCATDVAARGLDVKDVTHVINYDFPRTKGKGGIEDYVHRIGRTGRAGNKGIAYTFFTNEDSSHARTLVTLLKEAKQEAPESLLNMAAQPRSGGKGGGRNRWRGGGGGGRGGGGGGRGRRGGWSRR